MHEIVVGINPGEAKHYEFIERVLKDLEIHENNKNIPQVFRDQIPGFRYSLNEIAEMEDEAELIAELENYMAELSNEMDSLNVEEQIYFNMIYHISDYNNLAMDTDSRISSDDESDIDSEQEVDRSMSNDDDDNSVASESSDWTTDSDESQRDSDDEAYYSEPQVLEEARANYNRINRDFIILKGWLEKANKVLENAESKMEALSNNTYSAQYKEAEGCVTQATEIQSECAEKFDKKRIELIEAKALLMKELKEHWQEKAGEGNDPIEAYFNAFLKMGIEYDLFETEINHLCFKAITMVFATNQVGIHRAVFDAKQKLLDAEQKVLDAHIKFNQEAQKLIDTDDIFSLDTKKELREARDEYSDAKKSHNRAVVLETYLSEMLESGIDFDEVLDIVDWQIDFLERRCNFLYIDKCHAEAEANRLQAAYKSRVDSVVDNPTATVKDHVQALEFKKSLTSGELWKHAKRFQKEHRDNVAQLEGVKELKGRIETFRDEEKEVVEVDSTALQSFFDNTFKHEKQDNTIMYALGGLLLVASAAVCIYLARNHEATTALRSYGSNAMEKIASTTIGEFAGKMLTSLSNTMFR